MITLHARPEHHVARLSKRLVSTGLAALVTLALAAIGTEAASADETDDEVITHTASAITRTYTDDGGNDWSQESPLATLVSDVILSALEDYGDDSADFGVINPGAIRADLPKGDVTRAQALAVLPFTNNNQLHTQQLTGAQIIEMLEQQWQDPDSGEPSIALGLSSNVTYTYDADAAQGQHIVSVMLGGTPVDKAQTYRVGSIGFLLDGGDGFSVFSDLSDSTLFSPDVSHQSAWVTALSAYSPSSPLEAPTVQHAAAVGSDTYLYAQVDGSEVLARWYHPTVGDIAVTAFDVWLTRTGSTDPVTEVAHLGADAYRTIFRDVEAGSYTLHLTTYTGEGSRLVSDPEYTQDLIVPEGITLIDPAVATMSVSVPAVTPACLDGASTRTFSWELLRSGDEDAHGGYSLVIDKGSQTIGLSAETIAFSLHGDLMDTTYFVAFHAPNGASYGDTVTDLNGITQHFEHSLSADAECVPTAGADVDADDLTDQHATEDTAEAVQPAAATELAETGGAFPQPLWAFALAGAGSLLIALARRAVSRH